MTFPLERWILEYIANQERKDREDLLHAVNKAKGKYHDTRKR